MDDFLPAIIVIISAMIGIISNSNKEKAKKAADARRAEAARVRAEAEKRRAATQPQPRPITPTMTPAQPRTTPAMPLSMEGASAAPRQAAQPKVHVHLEPDLISHDQSGSMESPRTEGVDPCHDGQMAPRTAFSETQAEQPALSLEWSGENMVKAFVMQEVLTRPGQRRQAR